MNHVNKIALILSFIFPGFGQIWNREFMKGISFAILHIILIILLIYPDSNLFPIGMVAIPILWIWGMVDASRIYYNYSSERRRVQRRRNIRLNLGIIALVIVTEAIFIPTTLTTIRRDYKASPKGDIYNKSDLNQTPSEESAYISNHISPKPLSPFDNSTSADNKNVQGSNNKHSSSDFELKQKQSNSISTITTNKDNFQSSRQFSPSHPWVVTVRVSEKYDEISKLYHKLHKKYEVQIIPTSSNPKHDAFAVVITDFATILDAQNAANKLRQEIPNCFVASYENPAIPVK